MTIPGKIVNLFPVPEGNSKSVTVEQMKQFGGLSAVSSP